MQDVDRPDDIQPLPVPAWCGRVRVDVHAPRLVSSSNKLLRIASHLRRRGDIRQQTAVRPAELERASLESLDPKAFLMHGAVVTATKQHEIRERGRPALRPVADVMRLTERQSTAGKPTPLITM